MVKKIEDMYINRLDTIPACDRRTDRQTNGYRHGIVCAMHMSRTVENQLAPLYDDNDQMASIR